MAIGVLACLGLGTVAGGSPGLLTTSEETAAGHAAAREAAQRASRSSARATDPSTKGAASAVEQAATTATSEERSSRDEAATAAKQTAPTATIAPPPPAVPAMPAPVAGLSQTQMNNASAIVKAGTSMGIPKRAFVIAVACALQESNLLNLASSALPESFSFPHEGVGSDHDSVGLFQQRPSAGWGSVEELMTPDYAARAFYQVLIQIPGWDTMALTYAAQSVQLSGYPDAYAQHEARAQLIVGALT